MLFELIILAISIVVNIALVLVVMAKDPRSATNRLFMLLALILAIEPPINSLSLHSNDHLLYIRLVMFLVVWMGMTFRWLAETIPEPIFAWSARRWLELAGTAGVSLLALTPLMFSEVTISPGGAINPSPAPGILAFVAIFIYSIIGGIMTLRRRRRNAKGHLRAQLNYVILGAAGAFGLSFIFNFVVAVVLRFSAIVTLSPLVLSLFTLAIATAIVRHRLFNIRSIVARSLAYFLLLGSLGVFYGVVIFALSRYLFGQEGGANVAQQTLYTAAAILMAFTFQPLRRFFERLTNGIFYRDLYDSQEVLNRLTTVLVSELDLTRILRRSLHRLCEDLHLHFGQIYVFDQQRVYRVEHYGPIPSRMMVSAKLVRLGSPMLVADDLVGGERKSLLDEHGIRLSIGLKTKGEQIGYLLLGDKLSGDVYSRQDIALIEIIAGELAVAIQNAKAYAEIQEFNLTLQERVNSATSRLRIANRNLKELDRAKDEFLSMASHQLRTPLTTIKGYLSMILEGDAGAVSPQQQEFVGYAFESSKRMVGLISDLLNVSRLAAGRFMIEPLPTDIVQVVTDEVRQLQTHADGKGLKLIFDPPAKPLPIVEIDENKTRQVIMNFIDNAIYYTAVGSVTVKLREHDGLIELRVTDTGIGVPEVARKKLFSKFFRATNAQSMRPDGTGLGLYLAKRVIEDQGGTIIFESSEGHGSTFGFLLPIKVTSTKIGIATTAIKPKVTRANN